MRTPTVALTGLLFAAATACSAANSNAPDTTASTGAVSHTPPSPAATSAPTGQPTQPTQVEAASDATALAIAQAAGCAEARVANKMIARTSATCVIGGHTVEVATFTNTVARDRYIDLGRQAGATMVHGKQWLAAGVGETLDELAIFHGQPIS